MRWNLPADDLPTAWFNVAPHLRMPLEPPLHPGAREPIDHDDLAPVFPMALIAQEVSTAPTIDIPGPVLDVLRSWWSTSLVRATRLEKPLGTPARISHKDESVSPAGSHKPNTAVPQAYDNEAYYSKDEGMTRLSTETAVGQWARALEFASSLYGLECMVHMAYMVRASFEEKPYRRTLMETWGARVVPSPVDDATHPGSLGSAISDADHDPAGRDGSHYSLGSVLNHVLPHQTVIGLEAKRQRQLAGKRLPDVVIGSCGGGSNLGGIRLPSVPDDGVRLAAVEPTSCPSLAGGAHRLRLRRHGRPHPTATHVHARTRLRPSVHPRRRLALPRQFAHHHQLARETGTHGGARISAIQDVPGRPAARSHAGDGPIRRGDPRDPCGHRRSAHRQGAGRGACDPLHLLGAWPCWTSPHTTTSCTTAWWTERAPRYGISTAIMSTSFFDLGAYAPRQR